MKKHLNLIGAAVAASLGAGSAFALPPNATFVATLTVSGSSAFEGAFQSELSGASSSLCTSGTYNLFLSSTNDFRAITCTAKPGIVTPGGTQGENVAIYYRGEGGSVVGLAPVVRNMTQYRLNLAACPTTVTLGATAAVTCTISSYNALNDANDGTAVGLEAAQSQLGFSDAEPAVFVGENYPSATVFNYLQPALTTGEISTLSSATNLKTQVAQSFSVYVSDFSLGTTATNEQKTLAALTGLSRNTLSNIMRGSYADWSQVPAVPGQNSSGFVVDPAAGNLPIKLCRREQGSGTQTTASMFFNDYVLSGQAFASSAAPINLDEVSAGAGGVKENTATGAMRSCLQNVTQTASGTTLAVGAIGFISSEADVASTTTVAGYKHLLIDGQGDTAANLAGLSQLVADGRYDYWYEVVSIKRQGLIGGAGNIADKLVSIGQKQATGPTSANITFLPTFNTPAYPLATPPAGKKFIGCLTRNGKSSNKGIWQCQ